MTKQKWVVGAIDTGTKEGFVVTFPDRKEETLKLIAETWIDKRLIIYSDEWKAYREALADFEHKTVRHKKMHKP